MGLDMYLYKAKRVDSITAKKLIEIENYFDYINRGNKYEDMTMSEWCGFEIDDDTIPFVKQYEDEYITRYSSWDKDKEYGHKAITDNVGYWRKANQIHNWFVNNVQDGEDDCGTYEVTKDQFVDLLDICEEVLAGTKLTAGMVWNGQHYDAESDSWVDDYIEGNIVADSSIAEELLPTTSGCFFGSTSYDQYYLDDVKYTAELIKELLNTTDFEKEIVMYHSSW